MLVDLPLLHVPADVKAGDRAEWVRLGMTFHERLDQGVYMAHTGSWTAAYDEFIKTDYPFNDRLDQIPMTFDGKWVEAYNSFPHDYGVCDNHQQILDKWPQLATMEEKFLIGLYPIYRVHQPPHGGWRWHKWGEYIGDYEPQHEYLSDESIDRVLIFRIVEVK